MQSSRSRVSLNGNQEAAVVVLADSRCPGVIGEALFFKPFSRQLDSAARQHIRLNALAGVAPGYVVRSFGVVEVHVAKQSARFLDDGEIEAAAPPTLNVPEAARHVEYGLVLELVGGIEALVAREAALDGKSAPISMPSKEELLNLLRGYSKEELQRSLFSKLSRLFSRLHNEGYAHGDPHPSNIFLKIAGKDFDVVLIDPLDGCAHKEGYCEHFQTFSIWDAGFLAGYSRPFDKFNWGSYIAKSDPPIEYIRRTGR